MLKGFVSSTEDSVVGLSAGLEKIRPIVFPDKTASGDDKKKQDYWLLSNVEIIQSR